MAIKDFVLFDKPQEGKPCSPDADVAGIGVRFLPRFGDSTVLADRSVQVVASFTAAAIFTTTLSICAALLDGVNDEFQDSHAIFPKRFNDWLRRSASQRIRDRSPFYRDVLNRLMLAMADQQLLTGFAIIISGYIRAAEPGLPTSPKDATYLERLVEAHFHLIVYLSCLSSSSHLACVITLKRYFSQHNTSAWVRLGLIIVFALLLVATICLAVPFGPTLYVIKKIEEYKDDLDCENQGTTKCSDTKYYSGLILFYFVAIVAVLYPFWVAIIQLSEHTKKAIEKSIHRIWAIDAAWFPMRWIRKLWPRGNGRAARALRSVGAAFKAAFWMLLFGNMMTSFCQQLIFVTISLAFVLAQKFAKPPPELDSCSLNMPLANSWGFGQILPIILLGQFILSGSGAYYGEVSLECHQKQTWVTDTAFFVEIRDERYATRPDASPRVSRQLSRSPSLSASQSRFLPDGSIPQLYTSIPSSRISIDDARGPGDLSRQPSSVDLQNPSSTYRRDNQRFEMGDFEPPRMPGAANW